MEIKFKGKIIISFHKHLTPKSGHGDQTGMTCGNGMFLWLPKHTIVRKTKYRGYMEVPSRTPFSPLPSPIYEYD